MVQVVVLLKCMVEHVHSVLSGARCNIMGIGYAAYRKGVCSKAWDMIERVTYARLAYARPNSACLSTIILHLNAKNHHTVWCTMQLPANPNSYMRVNQLEANVLSQKLPSELHLRM